MSKKLKLKGKLENEWSICSDDIDLNKGSEFHLHLLFECGSALRLEENW